MLSSYLGLWSTNETNDEKTPIFPLTRNGGTSQIRLYFVSPGHYLDDKKTLNSHHNLLNHRNQNEAKPESFEPNHSSEDENSSLELSSPIRSDSGFTTIRRANSERTNHRSEYENIDDANANENINTNSSNDVTDTPASPTPTINSNYSTAIEKFANNTFTSALTWPLIWWVIFFTDAWKYNNRSEDLYGTTAKDLWFGLVLSRGELVSAQPNQNIVLNYYGGNDPGDSAAFFAPVTFTFAFILIAPLVEALMHKYYYKDYDDEPAKRSIKAKIIIWAIWGLIVGLPDLRTFTLFIQKSAKLYNYNVEKSECKFIYSIVTQVQESLCHICGNWPDRPEAYVNDIYTAQGCLDAILSKKLNPNKLYNYLQLLDLKKIDRLDLSKQEVAAWSDDITQKIFRLLHGTHLKELNFSLNEKNPYDFSLAKMQALAEFLRNANVLSVISSNNFFREEVANIFIKSMQNTSIARLTADNCNLGLINPKTIADFFQFTNLIHGDLSINQIDDTTYSYIHAAIIQSKNLISLILNDNKLSSLSVILLMEEIHKTLLKIVGLDGLTDISKVGGAAIGKAIARHPLEKLTLAHPTYSEGATDAMIVGLANSTLEVLDLSGIDLSDAETSANLFRNLPPTLKSLFITAAKLGDSGMSYLADYLLTASITELNIVENLFTIVGWKKFVEALAVSKIQKLAAGGHVLGNTANNALADAVRNKNISLTSINLSKTKIHNNSTLTLLIAFGDNKVEDIILSDNPLDDEFCNNLIGLIPGKKYRYIDIGSTLATGSCTVKMVEAARTTNSLQVIKADNLVYTNTDYFNIIKNFINWAYDLSVLRNKAMSVDAAISFAETAKPATSITNVDITTAYFKSEDNNYGYESIARAIPRAGILPQDFIYGSDNLAQIDYSPVRLISNTLEQSSINAEQYLLMALLALAILAILWGIKNKATAIFNNRNLLFSHTNSETNPTNANAPEAKASNVLRR